MALQFPLGEEENFRGVVDLVKMKAIIFDEGTLGSEFHEEEIPDSLIGLAKAYRESLFEKLADLDDDFMERYLAGEAFPEEEIRALIRKGTVRVADRSGLVRFGLQEQRNPAALGCRRRFHAFPGG